MQPMNYVKKRRTNMCESPEQRRKKEEARKEAIRDTYDVNADGEKHKARSHGDFGNQINNE